MPNLRIYRTFYNVEFPVARKLSGAKKRRAVLEADGGHGGGHGPAKWPKT
jgi:hypothetical protein